MMKKIFVSTASTLFYLLSNGQVNEGSLSTVNTISQAEDFTKANPKSAGHIFTIESSKDTSEILLPLYFKRPGFSFRIANMFYKILSVDSTLSFRVSYIYLNGEKLSKDEIDSLRQEIITKYKNGTSFIELAMQYNMDGNVTGDTGWFTENMMVKEFESAVRKHVKNDIFTVDTPGQNWYHVVLKTWDDTFIKKLTLIKIVTP